MKYLILNIHCFYCNRGTVKQAVQEISSSVPMVSAYQQNGNVMVMKTANLGMMRKIVNQVFFLLSKLRYSLFFQICTIVYSKTRF